MRTGRASQGQQRGTVGRAIEPPGFGKVVIQEGKKATWIQREGKGGQRGKSANYSSESACTNSSSPDGGRSGVVYTQQFQWKQSHSSEPERQ